MIRTAASLLFFLMSGFITAQTALFDYQREELPAMSLNGVPYFDARLLVSGGNPLMSENPLSALYNPAALADETRFSLSVSAKRHSAFQYWGINEGILIVPKALNEQNFGLSAAALSLELSGLTLAAGFAETALRAFPSFIYEKTQDYLNYTYRYSYQGQFTGAERSAFVALKREMLPRLHAGLTFSFSRTERSVSVTESWDYKPMSSSGWNSDFRMNQSENHTLTGFALIAGIAYSPIQSMKTAISIRIPLNGSADREISRELTVETDSRRSRHEAVDPFHRPLSVNASVLASLPLNIRRFSLQTGLNLLYTQWSGQRFVLFGKDLGEAMRNTLSTSLALRATWQTNLGVFDFSAGLRHDPQPLKTPAGTVLHWTGGISLREKWLEVDLTVAHLSSRIAEYDIPHTLLTCTSSIRF